MPTYNLVHKFEASIRVERVRVIDAGIGAPIEVTDIPYSQVKLDEATMVTIMKQANALVDNVVIYYSPTSSTPILSAAQWSVVEGAVSNGIASLINNLGDESFVAANIFTVKAADPDDWLGGLAALDGYTYVEDAGAYTTKVYLTYRPGILTTEPILPAKLGGVINDFHVQAD